MRRLAIFLLLASPAFGQLYSGILNTCTSNAQLAPTPAAGAAPACGYRWDLYTGIPGGIPTTLTQTGGTISASGGDDTSTINTAFAACTAGHFVNLAAGTFHASHLNLAVSNCELRGQGADQTIIIGTSTGDFVTLGSGSDVSYSGVNINSGASAGSQSFVLASAAGVSVGKYLIVTETNSTTNPPGSPSWVTIAGGEGQCNFCDGWSTNGTRARGQIEEVTSVSGTTIGITPPLDTDYTNTPTVVIMTASADHVGLRNLQLFNNSTNYGNMVVMQKCAYCYVQGIEDNYTGNPNGNYVEAKWSYRGEIRDNYFSNSFTHTSGNSDDSVFLVYKTTGFQVENNIVERSHVPFFAQWGASNNVFAYNFTQGSLDQGAQNFVIGGGGHHGAHPQFNLWEGNVMEQYYPDQVWGTSSHNTTFRNWLTGTTLACTPTTGRATVVCTPFHANGFASPGSWFPFQASRALQVGHWSWYYNFVGDVLGSADQMNMLANGNPATHVGIINYPGNRSYDSTNYNASFGYGESSDDGTGSGCSGGTAPCHGTQAAQTAFLYKEYTFANTTTNCTVGGNSGTCSAALPPSLVHSSKPAWWGSLPWPSIGPDVAGGTGPGGHASLTQSNPAQNCYFNIMGGQAGSPNSPLTFNAAACYSSAGVPVFSYAPNPVAFGNVAVGANSTVTVTITNSGTAGLIIGTLTKGSTLLTILSDTCSGTTVAASGTCTFNLKYAPISASALVCSPATFCVNVPDNAGNPDHINATGTGTVSVVYSTTTPGAGLTTWRATSAPTGSGLNAYCNPGGTIPYDGSWVGPTTDGVAQLPQKCNYTTLATTPTATWSAACPGGALNHNGNAATNGKCYIGNSGDVIPAGDPRAGQPVDYYKIGDALTSSVVGGIAQCGIWFNVLPTDDNTPTGAPRTYTEGATIPNGAQCNAANWNWLTTANFAGLPNDSTRITPAWAGVTSIIDYPTFAAPGVAGRYVPLWVAPGSQTSAMLILPFVSYWRFEGLELTSPNIPSYNVALISRDSGASGAALVQACIGLNNPVTGCPGVNPGNYTAVSNPTGSDFTGMTLPINIVIDHNQYPMLSVNGATGIVNAATTTGTALQINAVSPDSDHLVFDHMLVRGGNATNWVNQTTPTRQGINALASSGSLLNSYFAELWCGISNPYAGCGAVESQSIAFGSGQNIQKTVKLYNNFLASSSEPFIVGGSNWDQYAQDLEFRNNHTFKPLHWSKFCLPGVTPAYCQGANILAGTISTQILPLVGCTAGAGSITCTITGSSFPVGYSGNTPVTIAGCTGGSGFNIGMLLDTVSAPTFTGSGNATGSCSGGTVTQMIAPNIKNAGEFKNGWRVLFEGNLIDGTWEGESDQHGECFHLNLLQGRYGALPGARLTDVTVRYNIIAHCNKAVVITEEDAPGGDGPVTIPAVGNFSIHDNLMDDLNNTKWGTAANGSIDGVGGIALALGNPFAGVYVPQSITFDHNTFIMSSVGGATPPGNTRTQILGTTDTSNRPPFCTGTATASVNSDGTGLISAASFDPPCTGFTTPQLGLFMNFPQGSPNWYQIMSFPTGTTSRISVSAGTVAVAAPFLIPCASGCGTETAPATFYPRISFTNNIGSGGGYNQFAPPQTTVGALNELLDGSASNGWCFGPNIIATASMSGMTVTWPFPQAQSLNTSCPTTKITTTGCTALVGASANPCLNPDSPDRTMTGIGFTAWTNGQYTNLLPGGTNNYVLLNTSPGYQAGSDGKDLGADMTKVTTFTTGVE